MSQCPDLGSDPMSAPGSTLATTAAPTDPGGRPRLLLLDGHSLAYRAFFALPVENFSTTTGHPTNAVYDFRSMLINVLGDDQRTNFVGTFDVSGNAFRPMAYSDSTPNRSSS